MPGFKLVSDKSRQTLGLRPTNNIKNQIKLMPVVSSGEQRFATKQFRKDASNSPDINRLSTSRLGQGRCTVRQRDSHTLVYILKDNMISGARYHRVATYSVMSPTSFPPGLAERVLRASPKSQTLRSQFAFSRRLAGFKSRCTISAECIVLSARRT